MTKTDAITTSLISIAVIGLLLVFSPSASCEETKGGAVSLFAPSLMCR